MRQWVEKLGVPGFLIALGILSLAPLGWSQSPLAATDHSASANLQMQEVEGIPGLTRGPNGIPIGTKITMGNWQQYKSFMPDGLITLFEGTSFWKMPPDVEIDIGPTYNYPLPETFKKATQKYSGQVQLVQKPNGHWTLNNYYAGQPFPEPSEPNKGEKILADQWYAYGPHIAAVSPETGLASTCGQDHFLNRKTLGLELDLLSARDDIMLDRSDPVLESFLVRHPRLRGLSTRLVASFFSTRPQPAKKT